MHRLSTAFVLGYHGCDASVAEALLAGEPFRPSENDYDWLGPGVYFWEANPMRGLDFAIETKNAARRPDIETPAVVGAVIDLGFCLDLTSAMGVQAMQGAYRSYIEVCERAGYIPPENSPDRDSLRRPLDREVFRHLHRMRREHGRQPIDSVRGVFMEGKPAYPGAGFQEKTHIQLCVLNDANIKGVFRVRDDGAA